MDLNVLGYVVWPYCVYMYVLLPSSHPLLSPPPLTPSSHPLLSPPPSQGEQFVAALVPSATYLVVGFTQTRVGDAMVPTARVESVVNDVCVLTHYGDELSKIRGVVTGASLDASFQHVEEDVNYKPRGRHAQGSASDEEGAKGKGGKRKKKAAAAGRAAPKKVRAKKPKK
jgi:hypothetical protein